jgi:hypothetical protein
MSIQKITGTFLLGISLLTSLSAQDTRSTHWDFNDVQAGKLPSGWAIDATHPKEPLAIWEVIPKNISSPENKILALSKVQAYYGNTYNLCYTRSVPFLNGEISVQFKAVSGQIDQGGGIIWRVQDRDNYYVARFNPLEDNFRFYSVKNGIRDEIASAHITLDNGWHEMKIIQHNTHFEGYIDGKKLLESDNGDCTKSGGTGLWTKADAATAFDDFKVSTVTK